MSIFEGKSPAERNKIILAAVLGALALFVVGYNIIGFFPSRKTTVTVSVSPTPATASAAQNRGDTVISALPSQDDIYLEYTSLPIGFPVVPNAQAPGRNIFAFYEPGKPTPFSPTPPPTPKPATPIPPPTYDHLIAFVTPQSVYAGSKGFRFEVNGDKFTPEVRIYLNGIELSTNYVSPQKLVTDISANMIAYEGSAQIVVRLPDGTTSSNSVFLNIQAPPKPQFQYVGLIARKRNNNDTAYLQEQGKQTPIAARLNDVVGGRFRVVSISSDEILMEDVSLGFRHKLELYRPPPGQSTSFGSGRNPAPYNPSIPTISQPQQEEIPGIPNNIPRYRPTPRPTQSPQNQKRDSDDDDDDDDGDNGDGR